ncbi:MAG: SRPBCC family protein [Candidatus Acidiferrales bacterium]
MSRRRIAWAVIVAVAVLAPLVVWVKGGAPRFYAAEVEVRAPADRVFPYLTEPEKMKQWVAGLVEWRREGAGPEDRGAGSRPQGVLADSRPRNGEASTEKGNGAQVAALPPEVGARSIQVVEREGERVEVATEIQRVEKNQLLQVRMQAPFFDAVNHLDLTPTASGTRVTQNLTVSYKGWARFLAPFTDDKTRSALESDLERLKQAIENAPVQPAVPPAANTPPPN